MYRKNRKQALCLNVWMVSGSQIWFGLATHHQLLLLALTLLPYLRIGYFWNSTVLGGGGVDMLISLQSSCYCLIQITSRASPPHPFSSLFTCVSGIWNLWTTDPNIVNGQGLWSGNCTHISIVSIEATLQNPQCISSAAESQSRRVLSMVVHLAFYSTSTGACRSWIPTRVSSLFRSRTNDRFGA